jgi:hypothetical protein
MYRAAKPFFLKIFTSLIFPLRSVSVMMVLGVLVMTESMNSFFIRGSSNDSKRMSAKEVKKLSTLIVS